jgi:hypothetical protein
MLGANHIPDDMVASNDSALNGTDHAEFVCAFYNPDFIIYSSLGSFYIPCVIMVFLYARIFKVGIHVNANYACCNTLSIC